MPGVDGNYQCLAVGEPDFLYVVSRSSVLNGAEQKSTETVLLFTLGLCV